MWFEMNFRSTFRFVVCCSFKANKSSYQYLTSTFIRYVRNELKRWRIFRFKSDRQRKYFKNKNERNKYICGNNTLEPKNTEWSCIYYKCCMCELCVYMQWRALLLQSYSTKTNWLWRWTDNPIERRKQITDVSWLVYAQ